MHILSRHPVICSIEILRKPFTQTNSPHRRNNSILAVLRWFTMTARGIRFNNLTRPSFLLDHFLDICRFPDIL